MFMPACDVIERHKIDAMAPSVVTFGALMDLDLQDSAVIRSIFKAREWLLGTSAADNVRARGLVQLTKELGWIVLGRGARPRNPDGRRNPALESRRSLPRHPARTVCGLQ